MPVNAPDSPYTFALPPGTLLTNRFRLDGLVSTGSAFAISYDAKDLMTGDSVLVKEFFPRSLVSRTEGGSVRPHSSEDERDYLRALRRFALEGAALLEASHPNLVRVRRVIEANDTVYLVMDRHRTQALADFLRPAGGRLAPAQAGRLIQQLLSALEPLHAESIVHRDLSPRSVHVSADGNLLLLGFSARRHLALHASDLVPGFAAFEQYGTRDIGPWTDVYAASAILYYLLTGLTPPSALERAAGEALAPPSGVIPGISSGLTRLVLRGMALLPQQRPHAASEMRRQLETALLDNTAAPGPAPAAPVSLGFDASPLSSPAPDDADRGSTLRLAEGGIVVPGAEPAAPWLLRKLGSALRRTPTSADVPVEPAPVERAAPPWPRDVTQSASAPIAPTPAPRPVAATPAAATPVTAAPVAAAPAAPVVPTVVVPEAAAPATTVAVFAAPVAEEAAPEPIVPNEPASPVMTGEALSESSILSVIETASPLETVRHSLAPAEEMALVSQELQAQLARPGQRRRYGVLAAAVLVLGVGSSLVLATRSGGASSDRVATAATLDGRPRMGEPPKPPAQTPSHEVIESGAVQQSRASALRTSSERPALVTERVSTTARPVATAVSPKAGAPARSEPSTVLPQPRLPNLSISVSGASDLKILPPEMLVDARTRLTNGEDLVEQGDYLVARRIFRAALVQLDSIGARYPESQSVRSLRREIEQADVRAGQACGAENEMRKRRGESLRGCQ